MLTKRDTRPARHLLAGALTFVFTLAACGGAAAPSASPVADASGTPKPTPTNVPGQSGDGTGVVDPGTGSGGSGGGSGGNTGGGFDPGGIIFPQPPDQIDQGLIGDANYLTPTKGLLNPRHVNVQLVR